MRTEIPVNCNLQNCEFRIVIRTLIFKTFCATWWLLRNVPRLKRSNGKEVLLTSAIALCNTIKKNESNHSLSLTNNNNNICKYLRWENAKRGNESFCQYFFSFLIIFWSVSVVVPSLGVHKFKELKTLSYLFSSFKDHKTF